MKLYHQRWPSEAWWIRDLAVGDATWRVVAVDASPDAPLVDEAFWLPKVTGPAAHYDHLVVLVGESPRSTVAGAASAAARDLVELADECSDGRLRLVVAGGDGANEFFLPDGEWGEAVVDAGNAGVAGPAIGDDALDALPTGFRTGIRGARARVGAGSGAIAGWWALELHPSSLVLTFQWLGPDAVVPVTRAHSAAIAGWSVRALEPVTN